MSMPWVVDRFRHHVVAGGWRHSVARAASRALDLAAGRVQSASARLLDPTATDRRLPKRIGDQLALNAAFRNRFRDARALVVASGPSARRLDAQMADGRAIIVVNEMFGQVKGAGLRLTAVVLHDQLYFSGTPEMDRFLSDITDVDIGTIDSGTQVRMVFRIKDFDDKRGFRRYFWKAAPVY